MKRVILTLAAFVAFNSNAQIKVQENTVKDSVVWRASKLNVVPSISRFVNDGDTSFTIYYQNSKYTAITDIRYLTIGDAETSKQFFGILLDVIDNDKKFNIEIGGEKLYIYKTMACAFISSDVSSFFLSRKHLESILQKF